MKHWLISVVVLLPLLVGSSERPVPTSGPNIQDCPFAVDPNLIVGQFLGCVRLEVGQAFVRTSTWSDAEGDPASVELLQAPAGVQLVDRPKTSSYTLLWTPREPMIAAIVLRVTDQPADARPMSQTGTLIVQVVPRRLRLIPKGCGGQP
jgi:hypothetical protein